MSGNTYSHAQAIIIDENVRESIYDILKENTKIQEWYSAPTSLKVVVLGDVNLDGTVTVNDVTLLQKYLAAIVTLNNEQLLAADYNRDGMITIYDCTLIQMKASGLI